MLEMLLILLTTSIVYYLLIGAVVSLCIMVFQIIFPYSLDFSLKDHLLFVLLWASVILRVCIHDSQKNQ